ncbi:MAG: DUF4255 domain-containing protein [Bacteroidetes bacterium]|nr:DUF4255 domain-containing protein [Bacteroidota bacterium]
MIYHALHTVANELNDYLVARFKVDGHRAAVVNSIVVQDGSIAENSRNQMVLSLINLEYVISKSSNRKNHLTKKPANVPYHFNLDVLITAVFEAPNYDEGLKYLSETIYFFQAKNIFNGDNTPSLDNHIHELKFELINLNEHQRQSLWGAMGVRYMPSVVFKVRTLSFEARASDLSSIS